MQRRRDTAQDEATAELRRRHDAAPWLREHSPEVKSMRLVFEEERADGGTSARSYARPYVVESARAHFEVRCLEPRCDGVHDLTATILLAINKRRTFDRVRSSCEGSINNVPCNRTLICTFEIGYRE